MNLSRRTKRAGYSPLTRRDAILWKTSIEVSFTVPSRFSSSGLPMVDYSSNSVQARRSRSRTCGPTPVAVILWRPSQERSTGSKVSVKPPCFIPSQLTPLPVGVCIAATRKLKQELGIEPEQAPPDQFKYLGKLYYLAPSGGLWGEHESKRS